jgi:hypothetical protein
MREPDMENPVYSGPLGLVEPGLGAGALGAILAQAGVGKTACLTRIALDYLQAKQGVLHVALGQTLEQVRAGYVAQLHRLLAPVRPSQREMKRARLSRDRWIQAYPSNHLTAERLSGLVDMAMNQLELEPGAILIDGFDWEGPLADATVADFRQIARRSGATLWMTMVTRRADVGPQPDALPDNLAGFADQIDAALFLEPRGAQLAVRRLDHPDPTPEQRLLLDCGGHDAGTALVNAGVTLLSGGARGAEAEFGACAEHWGLTEITYSFAGREVVRSRGLVELGEAELNKGDVSPAYLTARMNRTYSDAPEFRRMLQTIWHQVSSAGEVFMVGSIQPDATVRGGTGWAAELARRWSKPLYVFDQDRGGWFAWWDDEWIEESRPRIRAARFTGTGTRGLRGSGRQAIQDLFEDSFGAQATED